MSNTMARNAPSADWKRSASHLKLTLSEESSRVRKSGSLPPGKGSWAVLKHLAHRA